MIDLSEEPLEENIATGKRIFNQMQNGNALE